MSRKPRIRQQDRRGIILVLAALMMATLVGMVAFAVDYGHLVKARTDLQRSADASALAAVQDLVPRNDGSQDLNKARETVRTYARNNLNNQSIQVAAGDIEIGRYDSQSIYSNVRLLNTGTFDTVRVTLRRDGATNPRVPLFFARIFGMKEAAVTANATAILQKAEIMGPGTAVLPFATPVQLWDSLGPGDTWSAYGDGKLKNASGNTVPGNWGTVDIGSTNNSTSDLRDQIVNGLRQSDLNALHSDGRIAQNSYVDASDATWMNGDPGLSSGMRSAVQAVQNQQRLIPIYDQLGGGGGNNSEFHVVKWGVVTVLDSHWGGSNNTYVKVRKSHTYSGSLRANSDLGSGTAYIEGAYTTPALVE
jgi:Putative Flp pilus-assembly TadE/G-like